MRKRWSRHCTQMERSQPWLNRFTRDLCRVSDIQSPSWEAYGLALRIYEVCRFAKPSYRLNDERPL